MTARGFCRTCDSEEEHESKVESNLDSAERAIRTQEAVDALNTRLKCSQEYPEKTLDFMVKSID